MDASERRLLAAMPLHAITATRGEPGLRERLAIETASLPAAGLRQVGKALRLASRLHTADRRQREPYINHLLRVAIRIAHYYRVADPDVICAALLHDAVEDHAAELAGVQAGVQAGAGSARPAAFAVLTREFSGRVADLVAAVTNPEPVAGRDRGEQYREHVAESLERSPWARVIKISDFTDNGVGLIHTTGPRLRQLAGKYAPLVPVLSDLISRPDTPLGDDVKARIAGQLTRAQERFAAILSGAESASTGSSGAESASAGSASTDSAGAAVG